jgi:hypothetical protein
VEDLGVGGGGGDHGDFDVEVGVEIFALMAFQEDGDLVVVEFLLVVV